MKQIVTTTHRTPVHRNGDLEDDLIVWTNEFITRRAAKNYIEDKVAKKSDVKREYHRGDKPSVVLCFTGKTWTNENTGEVCEESYKFIMTKV